MDKKKEDLGGEGDAAKRPPIKFILANPSQKTGDKGLPMFGNLAPLGANRASGDPTTSIFSQQNILPQLPEQKKEDFPPPINTLFSFDLQKLASQKVKATEAPKYDITSVELVAKKHLENIQDLVEDDEKHDNNSNSLFSFKKEEQPTVEKKGMFPSSILSSLGNKNPLQKTPSNNDAPLQQQSLFRNPTPGMFSTGFGAGPNLARSLSNPVQSTGDVISSKYHTYNSISTLAPILNQDENLSLSQNSKISKIFVNNGKNPTAKAQNLIVFLDQQEQENDTPASQNNISFLINQSDQISNILSGYHQKGKLEGTILDFTILNFRYLYLLYAKSIVVLDIKDLLSSDSNDDTQILESIQLIQDTPNAFKCIESHEHGLILFSDIASRKAVSDPGTKESPSSQGSEILLIHCSTDDGGNLQHVQTMLSLEDQKSSTILDVEIWEKYLAVLLEKNIIIVFDLAETQIQANKSSRFAGKSKQKKQSENEIKKNVNHFEKPIFRAKYADATDSISQLFFIADFQKKKAEETTSEENESGDEENEEDKKLRGCFLLVETKNLSKQSEAAKKEMKKKTFRKLHIIEIQDPIGPLCLLDAKYKGPQQQIKQIDLLTITEITSKFVEYDSQKGIIFLLNQEKSDKLIKLLTVKLKKDTVTTDESDSDDAPKGQSLQKLRFEYITEFRLQISNQSFSAIQKAVLKKKVSSPQSLNVLRIVNPESEDYFIYTSIFDQVLVFQKSIQAMRPSCSELVKSLSSSSQKPMSSINQQQKGVIDFTKLGQIPEDYKNKILKQSRDMMFTTKNESEQDQQEVEDSEEEAGGDMVDNLIGDDSEQDLKNEQNYVDDIMRKIDQECKEEEENDAKLLQQRIDEEIREVLTPDEDQEPAKETKKKKDFMYVVKNKEEEKDQVLSKKEKKALKKKEENKKKLASRPQTPKKNDSSLDKINLASNPLKKKSSQSQKQQDQIIDNFQELTKKYQDLAQKMNQLQQQVNRQQIQKLEVEAIIKKSVKEGINGLVMQQVRDIIVPLITKKLKTMDEQVNEVILPKVEDLIGKLFKDMIERGEAKGPTEGQINEKNVKQIIQKEFREAMNNKIVPKIEESLVLVISQLEKKLQQVNLALCEKLAEEEDRNEQMVEAYQNSLVWLKLLHQKVGNIAKEQIKDQTMNYIEYSQEISKQFQNEMKNKIQDMIHGQVQLQIQQQVQIQVQQQLQMSQQNQQPFYQPQTPTLQPLITHTPQASSFAQPVGTPHGPTPTNFLQHQSSFHQAPLLERQPSNFTNVLITPSQPHQQQQQQDAETNQIMAQIAELQKTLKLKQQNTLGMGKKQLSQSSQKNVDEDTRLQRQLDEIDDYGKRFMMKMEKGSYQQTGGKSMSQVILSNNKPVYLYDDSDEEEKDMMLLLQHQKIQERKKQKAIEESQLRRKQAARQMNQVSVFDELEAKRGSDNEKEDIDDAEYGHEEDQYNEEEIGSTFLKDSRIKSGLPPDQPEYMEASRPYDDEPVDQVFKKPSGGNRGVMRLLNQQKMGAPLEKSEPIDDDRNRHLDALIYQGLTDKHIDRLKNDEKESASSKTNSRRQLVRATDILNSSLEDGPKKKGKLRELQSWNDSSKQVQEDPFQSFTGYGIQQNLSQGQKKQQRNRKLESWM